MASKMVNCATCGNEIAQSAKVCPKCGAKNKKPFHKRGGFIALAIILCFGIIGSIGSNTGNNSSSGGTNNTNATVDSNKVVSQATVETNNEFSGESGITASAEIVSNMIGYPELHISVNNASDKEIAAIQFYAVPYDVYGKEITGWTSQNRLYTDDRLAPGASDSLTYQFIEDSIKTVNLYVYSVFYADGTEWGNKDATTSTILKQGHLIEVEGES